MKHATSKELVPSRELLPLLEEMAATLPALSCRLFPASFDPENARLHAFPRPLSWRWRSCEDALRRFKSRGILMHLPLFWQVESLLYAAGQAAGAPLFVNDRANMPVGAEALRAAGLDTVVTGAEDAAAFAAYLIERGSPARCWILVHPLPANSWDISPLLRESDHTTQEVHLFPGVPLLEQCAHLCEERAARFHLCEPLRLEDGKTLLSPGDECLPPWQLTLPHALKEDGGCACGRVIVTRADSVSNA